MHLKKYFSTLAAESAIPAVIPDEIAKRLLARLDMISVIPDVIVEVGCGRGLTLPLLQHRYPQAKVIGLDIAEPFLSAIPDCLTIVADANQMPLKKASVDVVIANVLLPWAGTPLQVFQQIHSILKPSGLFLFSAYGPDTCQEIGYLSELIDMHLVGDALVQANFGDPVLEVQSIALRSNDQQQMVSELYQQGWGYFFPEKLTSLAVTEVTYEIIFGHGWAREIIDPAAPINFPLSQLQRRKK